MRSNREQHTILCHDFVDQRHVTQNFLKVLPDRSKFSQELMYIGLTVIAVESAPPRLSTKATVTVNVTSFGVASGLLQLPEALDEPANLIV